MENLKNMQAEEIVELIKEGKIGAADLTDAGICPTCFNSEHDSIVFGDDSDKLFYENDLFKCILVGNPRAEGHAAIITKKHFKDMMEVDDETCKAIFVLAKKVMNVIREVYASESVYLCTMCDGPMNHFHVQLIPRYSFEKRGSKNFTKDRIEYKENKEKLALLRAKLS